MPDFRRLLPLAAAAVTLPTAALAHVGVAPHAHSDLLAGALHPLTGVDHLAAMVAVGLFAAALGGRAMLAVPAAFVTVLALAAAAGAAGLALPGVEPMIAASVVALGLLVALRVQVPTPAAALLVGVFAVFHGHAHGAEMPVMADPIAYGLGFVGATAALHGVGIAAGLALGGANGRLARVLGGAIAAFGVLLAAAG